MGCIPRTLCLRWCPMAPSRSLNADASSARVDCTGGRAHERPVRGGAHPRVRSLIEEPRERCGCVFDASQPTRDCAGQPPCHLREGSERRGRRDRGVSRGHIGLGPHGHRRGPSGDAPGAPGGPLGAADGAQDAEARQWRYVPSLDDGDERGKRTACIGDHRREAIGPFVRGTGDPPESLRARRREPRGGGPRGADGGHQGADYSLRRRRRLRVPRLDLRRGERDVPPEHARDGDAALQARARDR